MDSSQLHRAVLFLIEFDKSGMANAGVIGRPERTPSLGRTKDRKRFTDFGASARRSNGKPYGGDVLGLRSRVNAEVCGASKPETMRELARQLVTEAPAAVESAAQHGEQPPQWVQAFMSPAGWERYHQLRNEAGYSGETAPAITEPAPPTGGVAGFYAPDDDILASHTQSGQGSHQLKDSVQAVPADTPRRDDTP